MEGAKVWRRSRLDFENICALAFSPGVKAVKNMAIIFI
jgi:hypothetical protein